jgi:hypothetical protein
LQEPAATTASGGLKNYGWWGLGLISIAETALILQDDYPIAREASLWTTPVCWWGYILFIDAIIFRLKGDSLLTTRRSDFFLQIPLSVAFWLVFEIYNLHLQNWKYVGLPENPVVLFVGMGSAFATIMPGMFLTAELLQTLNIFQNFRISPLKVTNRLLYGGIILGFLFLMIPVLVSQHYARYLFALVWTGFVLLIEPIVYSSRGQSLLRDLEEGVLERILCLFVAGYLCGLLWEFWNYWAAAKWVYTAPFTPNIKIFEMPMAGFLGFGPFAWEYFAVYNLVKLFQKKS